jgi:hypothetical protein
VDSREDNLPPQTAEFAAVSTAPPAGGDWESNGTLYLCHQFVGAEGFAIGDVENKVRSRGTSKCWPNSDGPAGARPAGRLLRRQAGL